MATKHKQHNTTVAQSTKKKAQKHVHVPRESIVKNVVIPKWMLPTIVLVTVLAFIPVLNADFVSLDDADYVTKNVLLKSGALRQLLTTPVQGNHHPLTMLSLYFNYLISGDKAWSYHLFNLVFHLISTILVFRLAFLLSKQNVIIAFTTSILFAIHPLHVESVAWISERKDVLYGLFFVAGLIAYTKFIDTKTKKYYWFAVLFLVLSLLSKPAAVIFPVALFCIDLLRERKLNAALFLEKIPFFLLAMVLGILTMLEQKAAGATGQENFSIVTKILFGFYGIMMYAVKLLLPFKLAVFYPYPAINTALPIDYYLGPVFFIGLVVLFFYSLNRDRAIAFGITFYLVNLLLVLQFLPVGSAVIAERYTYIAYIGLFFALGWLLDRYAKSVLAKSYWILFPVVFLFSIATYTQASVWKNSDTLWDHTIATHPSNKAYANRATLLRAEKNYDLALDYFNKALELSTIDYESYNNRGNVYFDLKKPQLALQDYRKAISIKADYYPAMDNMAVQYAVAGQYDSALMYENKVLQINPSYKIAYSNRALMFMQLNKNEEALKDWQKFLEFEPDAADVYNTMGNCYLALGKYNDALTVINKAISMNAAPEFYLNRAYTYKALNNLNAAKNDALIAKKSGIEIPVDLVKSLGL